MVDKTCMKCGKTGLTWNKKYHDLTGLWKLSDHKNNENEWCVKNDRDKTFIRTKHDVVMCELCKESNFGLCTPETIDMHLKKYHPNGEILTNEDYVMKD